MLLIDESYSAIDVDGLIVLQLLHDLSLLFSFFCQVVEKLLITLDLFARTIEQDLEALFVGPIREHTVLSLFFYCFDPVPANHKLFSGSRLDLVVFRLDCQSIIGLCEERNVKIAFISFDLLQHRIVLGLALAKQSVSFLAYFVMREFLTVLANLVPRTDKVNGSN